MIKKSVLTIITLMAITFVVVFISCDKAKVDTNLQTPTDNALSSQEFMHLVSTINTNVKIKGSHEVGRISAVRYPLVTWSDTTVVNWPRIMTINYGPGLVDSSDSRTRSGIVNVSFNNRWSIYGTVATVSYSNYSVNSMSFSVSKLTLSHDGDSLYTEVITGGVCKSSSYSIFYSASLGVLWAKGINDNTASHSIYNFAGTGSGTDRNQVNYSFAITSALVKPSNCGYISQGNLKITPAGLAIRVLDFGGGTCDNQANVTINGSSYGLTLQ